jgi:hypothetical protein
MPEAIVAHRKHDLKITEAFRKCILGLGHLF